MTEATCEICGSCRFVEAHHYDCLEGKLSPETIMLCRRCHRTYHDRGIGWFDDEFLGKAIEMENKHREISWLKPYSLLRHEDIERSDYWNKTHGVKKPRKPLRETREAKQLGFNLIDNLFLEGG